MMKFLLWLGQFVHDSATGKPSVKRYGFAITVTVLCGVLFGLGIVVAQAVVHSSGRDQVDITRIAAETIQWVSTALIGTVGTTYVADKQMTRKSNASAQTDSQ